MQGMARPHFTIPHGTHATIRRNIGLRLARLEERKDGRQSSVTVSGTRGRLHHDGILQRGRPNQINSCSRASKVIWIGF
jgi:hypothetical protein